MFSSIGWPEILVILLLAIVVIGPERLPQVITDIRAAIYAARKAINNAKAELEGDMGGIGSEFDSLRGPISQAAEWTRMGPRGALTKVLFDGDDSAWQDFDPRRAPAPAREKPSAAAGGQAGAAPRGAGFDYSQVFSAPSRKAQPPAPAPERKEGGGWTDVT